MAGRNLIFYATVGDIKGMLDLVKKLFDPQHPEITTSLSQKVVNYSEMAHGVSVTPLYMALDNNHMDVALYLISMGADTKDKACLDLCKEKETTSKEKRAKWVAYRSEWKKIEAKNQFFSFASRMEEVERKFPTVSHLKGMSKEFQPIDPAFHMVANVLRHGETNSTNPTWKPEFETNVKTNAKKDLKDWTLQELNESIEKDLNIIKEVSVAAERGCCFVFPLFVLTLFFILFFVERSCTAITSAARMENSPPLLNN